MSRTPPRVCGLYLLENRRSMRCIMHMPCICGVLIQLQLQTLKLSTPQRSARNRGEEGSWTTSLSIHNDDFHPVFWKSQGPYDEGDFGGEGGALASDVRSYGLAAAYPRSMSYRPQHPSSRRIIRPVLYTKKRHHVKIETRVEAFELYRVIAYKA